MTSATSDLGPAPAPRALPALRAFLPPWAPLGRAPPGRARGVREPARPGVLPPTGWSVASAGGLCSVTDRSANLVNAFTSTNAHSVDRRRALRPPAVGPRPAGPPRPRAGLPQPGHPGRRA